MNGKSCFFVNDSLAVLAELLQETLSINCQPLLTSLSNTITISVIGYNYDYTLDNYYNVTVPEDNSAISWLHFIMKLD